MQNDFHAFYCSCILICFDFDGYKLHWFHRIYLKCYPYRWMFITRFNRQTNTNAPMTQDIRRVITKTWTFTVIDHCLSFFKIKLYLNYGNSLISGLFVPTILGDSNMCLKRTWYRNLLNNLPSTPFICISRRSINGRLLPPSHQFLKL